MKRVLDYKIESEEESVLSFLRNHGYSRHVITALKKTDHGILADGEWVHVGKPLHPGQILTICYEETEGSETIVPVSGKLNIVYEDEDIIVLNKPADMPVHPSQGNYDNTLANVLAYYYEQKGTQFVCRCINRLDRDTTGLLVMAKHGISACGLSAQMKERTIKREYQAVVTGQTAPHGCISAPIARKEGSTIERMVDFDKGERAVTYYERMAVKNNHTLLRIHLQTGRTHQIRVHMKYIGHPLPGDYLYHPDYTIFARQPLHSSALSFLHPITGQKMDFRAELPEDMAQFICSCAVKKDFSESKECGKL